MFMFMDIPTISFCVTTNCQTSAAAEKCAVPRSF